MYRNRTRLQGEKISFEAHPDKNSLRPTFSLDVSQLQLGLWQYIEEAKFLGYENFVQIQYEGDVLGVCPLCRHAETSCSCVMISDVMSAESVSKYLDYSSLNYSLDYSLDSSGPNHRSLLPEKIFNTVSEVVSYGQTVAVVEDYNPYYKMLATWQGISSDGHAIVKIVGSERTLEYDMLSEVFVNHEIPQKD